MQSENKFIDDLAKVTTGALGVLGGLREEVDGVMRARFDRWLAGLDLVRRDEFDAVKAMAAKARAENAALATRLEALESALQAKSPARAARPSKTAAKE